MKQKWIFGSGVIITFIFIIIAYSSDHVPLTSATMSNPVSSALVKKENSIKSNSSAIKQIKNSPISDKSTKMNDIVTCKKDMFFQLLQEEKSDDTFEDLHNKFKNNRAIESQIAFTLSSIPEDLNLSHERLIKLFTSTPNHKLLSHLLLNSCSLSEQGCEQSLISEAINSAPQNGATWLTAALHELKHNNHERAIIYLHEASNAPIFNDLWGNYIALFDTALSQLGIKDTLERKVGALGFSAAMSMPSYTPLTNLCKNAKPDNLQLLSLCLSIGKQLSYGKSSLLSKYIGLSLQENVYKQQQNLTGIQSIKDERQKTIDSQKLVGNAHQLVLLNRKRTNDWIQKLVDAGEIEANKYIVTEALKLSKNPDFNPCEVDW